MPQETRTSAGILLYLAVLETFFRSLQCYGLLVRGDISPAAFLRECGSPAEIRPARALSVYGCSCANPAENLLAGAGLRVEAYLYVSARAYLGAASAPFAEFSKFRPIGGELDGAQKADFGALAATGAFEAGPHHQTWKPYYPIPESFRPLLHVRSENTAAVAAKTDCQHLPVLDAQKGCVGRAVDYARQEASLPGAVYMSNHLIDGC